MLGKRFKKGFISPLKIKKWKKPFGKVKIVGKKFFFVNFNSFNLFINRLSFIKFKTRQYYIRNLNKKNLYKSFKHLISKKKVFLLILLFIYLKVIRFLVLLL